MKPISFISKQIIREMNLRRFGYSMGVVATSFLFLSCLYLLFFMHSQPIGSAPKKVYANQGQIIVALSGKQSSQAISKLYLSIRKWKPVNSIQFFAAPELNQEEVHLPPNITSGGGYFIIDAAHNSPTVLNRLKDISGVKSTLIAEQNISKGKTLFIFPSWLKGVVLAGTILFALVATALTNYTISSIIEKWSGDLETLKYGGIGSSKIKIPLIGYGVLCTTFGAGLGIILLYVASNWASTNEIARISLPALVNNRFILGLALWSGLLGPVIGFLGGGLGISKVKEVWAPRSLEDPINS